MNLSPETDLLFSEIGHCGEDCLFTAAKLLGHRTLNRRSIRNYFSLNEKRLGTTPEEFSQRARQIGYDARLKSFRSHTAKQEAVRWLRQQTSTGVPCILSVGRGTHWILIHGPCTPKYYCLDPELEGGFRLISEDRLLKRWWDPPSEGGDGFLALSIHPKSRQTLEFFARGHLPGNPALIQIKHDDDQERFLMDLRTKIHEESVHDFGSGKAATRLLEDILPSLQRDLIDLRPQKFDPTWFRAQSFLARSLFDALKLTVSPKNRAKFREACLRLLDQTRY